MYSAVPIRQRDRWCLTVADVLTVTPRLRVIDALTIASCARKPHLSGATLEYLNHKNPSWVRASPRAPVGFQLSVTPSCCCATMSNQKDVLDKTVQFLQKREGIDKVTAVGFELL